jgi:hypothetical protein
MLASRGISLALAGGAACLSWGLWAEADTPAKGPRAGQGRVTQVSATLPSDPAADVPAVIDPEAEALSPLDRLKARSPGERAKRITGRRASTPPLSADPVGQARATLPTPDDLRSRREAAPADVVVAEPVVVSTDAAQVDTESPAAPENKSAATAPVDTALVDTALQSPASTSDEPIAELPLHRSARRMSESPLATFAPVTDDAPASSREPARAPTSPLASAAESVATKPVPAPKSARVVTEFAPEEGTIPLEPNDSATTDSTPVPETPVAESSESVSDESVPEETVVDAAPVEEAPLEVDEMVTTPEPEPVVRRRSSPQDSEPSPEVESIRSTVAAEESVSGADEIEDEPLAALGSLPPHPEETDGAARQSKLEPIAAPRTTGSRRASLRQAEPETPMADPQANREPTRDPRELKGVKTIHPFKDYEPDEDIFKTDRCQNNCPRPLGEDCPDCKPGMSDDPNILNCPECPEEVALNSPEFQLSFPTRTFPALDYRWEATNVWHYPLYFEDTELERYGHSRPFFIQPVFSAARFGAQFLLLPYRASLLPPWKQDYELGHYRPGRCVPYRYEVLPWNRTAAVWQAGVTTGAYFLFAPTP